MTVTVMLAKMPFRTRFYNANQKVWLLFRTGSQACRVTGKYRGKGKYVEGWINWSGKEKPAPVFQVIDVPQEFAERHQLRPAVTAPNHDAAEAVLAAAIA